MDYEELLQKLIEIVETTAPQLWEIALRQVWASIIRDTLIGVAFLVGALKFFKWGRYVWDELDEEGGVLAFGASLVCGLIAAIVLFSQIAPIINPRFYAIRILIGLIK